MKPGKAQAFVPPPDGSKLHLSQAAVGGSPKAGERASLSLVMGDEQFRVVTFLGGAMEAAGLDLVLDSYCEFKVEGKQEVHLTGYLMPEFQDDYEEDEDDDDDMDDEDDDEDSDDGEMDEDGMLTKKEMEALQKLTGGRGKSSVKIEEVIEDEDDKSKSSKKSKMKVIEPDDSEEEEEDDEEEEEGEEEESEEGVDEDESEEEDDEEEKEEEEEEEKPTPPAKKAKVEQPSQAKTPQAKTPSKATPAKSESKKEGKRHVKQFENGFSIEYVSSGQADGAIAKPGKRCAMRYVGRLKSNGKVFDQTKGKASFAFRLGVGEVIKGWDKGVLGMRVGDKRKLTVPPQMAYGSSGVKGVIPPNATLEFEVELVNVK